MLEPTLFIAQDVTPWFNNPGLVGGMLGAGVGVLGGGIYGPLVAILAPSGRARAFVYSYHAALFLAGLILLAFGMTALMKGQPYGVWYSLSLPGLLLTVLFGCLAPVVRARYRQADVRRLDAEEFRRTGAGASQQA